MVSHIKINHKSLCIDLVSTMNGDKRSLDMTERDSNNNNNNVMHKTNSVSLLQLIWLGVVNPLPSSLPFRQKELSSQIWVKLKHWIISGCCRGLSITQARLSETEPGWSCISTAHGSSMRILSASFTPLVALAVIISRRKSCGSCHLLFFIISVSRKLQRLKLKSHNSS